MNTVEVANRSRVDEREWSRQAEDLAYYFAKPLGLSRWHYVESLPHFTAQPVEYQGRFDSLVLVQPPQNGKGLSLQRILDIVGLSYTLGLLGSYLKMKDWEGDRYQFKTPSVPYAVYVNDGIRSGEAKSKDILRGLKDDERGATGLEAIFRSVSDRGVLKRYFPIALGSRLEDDSLPWVGLSAGVPSIGHFGLSAIDYHGGYILAGRKIVAR